MSMKSHLIAAALLAFGTSALAQDAVPAPAAAPAAEAPLKYSNKWRIKFRGEAKSDGVLVFRMTQKGREPVQVSITVKDGTNDDNIADLAEDALQKAFPRDFNIEVDDGEDLLVKLAFWEGRSSLQLVGNDVRGLKIRIVRE
ncbi:hypothetical protein [Arenimonas maotaiensis]|nr:hypothetical protein [Arenimonas maotaiensis]